MCSAEHLRFLQRLGNLCRHYVIVQITSGLLHQEYFHGLDHKPLNVPIPATVKLAGYHRLYINTPQSHTKMHGVNQTHTLNLKKYKKKPLECMCV